MKHRRPKETTSQHFNYGFSLCFSRKSKGNLKKYDTSTTPRHRLAALADILLRMGKPTLPLLIPYYHLRVSTNNSAC